MFDFPASPTIGQVYPSPAVAGQPQYTWDGVKWTTVPTPAAIGSKAIVQDGSVPMLAQLTLSGDPAVATDAADKHYVDNAVLSATGGFPAGTVMLFYQAAAPTGWTKLTTQNDKALRVVSGSGGVAGGSNSFSTVMGQTTVGNTTLTAAQIPGITSSGNNSITLYFGGNSANFAPISPSGWGLAQFASPGSGSWYLPYSSVTGITYLSNAQGTVNIAVTSTNTGGGAHNHAITMNMAYVDVILASKN